MPSFLRPVDVEQLRFNQLRSQNTVLAPWDEAQAAQQQIDNDPRPVMFLPGSMGQNKWKTPGRGYDRGYGASARSVGVLAADYATPAPLGLMQPVPFLPASAVVRAEMNRLPRQRRTISVAQPLSRGLLQRNPEDMDFTNAAELRAVARARQDPTQAYERQDNIAARAFPSTYTFHAYDGFKMAPETVSTTTLQGIRSGGRLQPTILYTESSQGSSHTLQGTSSGMTGFQIAGTAVVLGIVGWVIVGAMSKGG